MNSMSLTHNPWSQNILIRTIPSATQITIPPACTASQFNALAPYYPIINKYETKER